MSSQFYPQFYAAAVETAIYAELWTRTQAGNHEASPGPTLRDILFPTQYTTPETPPPPFEETDTTAVESDTLPFANQTIVTEVRERPTEPQDHPGEGWRFNHPKTKRAYPFMIRRNGNLVRAKYIQYKRGQHHPMIEGTMGSGQTIYEAPLRAHDIDKHLPLLTPPQIRIFDYDTAGRPYVDRALTAIDDWPLTAEVKHYRTFVAELEEQHDQATRLRQTIADTMARIKNSVWRMSQNNIYQRVQTVIQREDDHDLWIRSPPTPPFVAGAKKLTTTPPTASPSRNAPTARSLAIEANTVTTLIATATWSVSSLVITAATHTHAASALYLTKMKSTKHSAAASAAMTASAAALSAVLDHKEGVMLHSRTFSPLLLHSPYEPNMLTPLSYLRTACNPPEL
ncbi:hypothetical protein EDB86DRAFT_3075600 [Lactarius hatsudake]|nr:hypothetical protein EDB86DRAFT_3075600 [Lactarius hatsudake]